MSQRLQPHERALTAAVHACFQRIRNQLVSSCEMLCSWEFMMGGELADWDDLLWTSSK